MLKKKQKRANNTCMHKVKIHKIGQAQNLNGCSSPQICLHKPILLPRLPRFRG